MKNFFSFQGLEFKRFFTVWNLAAFFLIFFISVFSVNRNTISYKSELSRSIEFQVNEADTFNKMSNYTEYSKSGIRYIVLPGPSIIFYSNTNTSDASGLSSRVNSVAALEIHKNLKGKSIFKVKSLLKLDYSELVLYIGCFLALLFGISAVRNKEFSKLIASQIPGWKLHVCIIISRFIVLTAGFILLSGCMMLVPLLHGVEIFSIDFSYFLTHLGVTVLNLAFFLVIGTIIGNFFNGKFRKTSMVIVWIVFVSGIPGLLDSINENESKFLISIHKLYHDKLKIVNEWEKRIAEEKVEFKNNTIEGAREIVEGYYKEVFPGIEAIEKQYKVEIEQIVERFRKRAIWAPTTFYNLVCSELSSLGFETYLEFLDFNIKKHREFLRFWINMVYYKYAKGPKKMENFIKGDENVFRASIKLPENTGTGFLINGVWILLLFIASHFLFKRSLFHMKEKEVKEAGTIEMEFDSGYFESFLTRNNLLVKLLYNLFSGHTAMLVKKGLQGEVSVNDVDILKEKFSEKFFFICRPEDIPRDIRVKNLFCFIGSLLKIPKKDRNAVLDMTAIKNIADKRFKTLNQEELFHAALALTYLVKSPLYLIHDIAGGKDKKYSSILMERVHQLKKENAIIIYLASPEMITDIPLPEGKSFTNGKTWLFFVEGNRLANKGKENGDTGKE